MAKTIFRDRQGFSKAFGEATTKAMNDTLQEAYDKLIDFINEDVYSLPESEWYERTQNLLSAFYIKPPKRSGGLGIQVNGAIKYRESKITHNIEKFQHGSPGFGPLNADVFFGILNGDVKQGSIFPEVEREPFFEDWVKWLNDNYESIYQKNLAKYVK